jgi:ribonucleoside-diphosphate reductase alpha chain
VSERPTGATRRPPFEVSGNRRPNGGQRPERWPRAGLRHARRAKTGEYNADRTSLHQSRTITLCGDLDFRKAKSEIRNPDGSVVFSLDGIDVPGGLVAGGVRRLAQKYFRKAGVPAQLKHVEENDVPSFLWRSVADEAALAEAARGASATAARPTAKQVFDRLAGCWTYWGWKGGYFDRGGRARLLRRDVLHARHADGRAELAAMVQHRPALGLRHRRPGQGHFYVDPKTGKLTLVELRL